jgi:predicted nucleic acid-binding protein
MKKSHNKNYKKTKLLLEELKENNEFFATTFVNIFEMHKGIYKSKEKESAAKSLEYILNEIPVLNFDEEYYAEYGKLSAYLERKGTPIGKFDELIAAIALHHGAKIVTNNTKDFARVPTLEIINY